MEQISIEAYIHKMQKTLYSRLKPANGKLYCCPYCDYVTKESSHLTRHIWTHTGEKPYSCDQCGYRTTCSSHLVRHNRTHSGEKPYLCPHCSYRTKDPSHLSRHLRTHSGEKPYACPHCNYRTKDSSHLARHRRTHVGKQHCNFLAADLSVRKLYSCVNSASLLALNRSIPDTALAEQKRSTLVQPIL